MTVVSVQATVTDRRQWLDLARRVDDGPWDTLYVPDHRGSSAAPFPALAAAAP